MIRYPWCCMYAATPLLARLGLVDNPTTAIVRAVFRISGMFGIRSLVHFQKLSEAIDLARGEKSQFAALQGFQFQKTDLHPPELFDQPPEVLEHDANLVLPAFHKPDFIPGIRGV